MRQVRQTQQEFGFGDTQFLMALRQTEDVEVDPFDPAQILAQGMPHLAVLLELLAVGAFHDERDEGDGAMRWILDHVEVGATDVQAVGGDDVGAAFERRPGARVGHGDGHSALAVVRFFVLDRDVARVRAAGTQVELVVLGDSKWCERPHVVRGAARQEASDVRFLPVGLVLERMLDQGFGLFGLLGIIRVEGILFTELEGVQNERVVRC